MNASQDTRNVLHALDTLGYRIFDVEVRAHAALEVTSTAITAKLAEPPRVYAIRAKKDGVGQFRIGLTGRGSIMVEQREGGLLTGSPAAQRLCREIEEIIQRP